MALRWYATAPIYFNGVRAFNRGDRVPDSIVAARSLAPTDTVTQIDVDVDDPAVVLRPLMLADLDTDEERELILPSRLSVEAQRAASVAAVEDAAEVAPTGQWDFAQAPTISGEPIGTGGGNSVPVPITKHSGSDSFGIGADALASLTAGHSSLAIGTDALRSLTTGITSLALGDRALALSTVGYANTAIGNDALGRNNDWVGDGVGGNHNVAVGLQSQRGPDDMTPNNGHHNTSIGVQTLWEITTGGNNVAIGFSALRKNRTGSDNVAIGTNALINAVGLSSNVAFGGGVMASKTSGSNNVGIGQDALGWGASGSDNTAIGFRAGLPNTGSYNTFIGRQAGMSSTANINNVVVIGNDAQATASNVAVIGNSGTTDRLSLCIGNTGVTGGGRGVFSLSDATVVPNANPTGGVLIYSTGGRAKIRQPDGTDMFVVLSAT